MLRGLPRCLPGISFVFFDKLLYAVQTANAKKIKGGCFQYNKNEFFSFLRLIFEYFQLNFGTYFFVAAICKDTPSFPHS